MNWGGNGGNNGMPDFGDFFNPDNNNSSTRRFINILDVIGILLRNFLRNHVFLNQFPVLIQLDLHRFGEFFSELLLLIRRVQLSYPTVGPSNYAESNIPRTIPPQLQDRFNNTVLAIINSTQDFASTMLATTLTFILRELYADYGRQDTKPVARLPQSCRVQAIASASNQLAQQERQSRVTPNNQPIPTCSRFVQSHNVFANRRGWDLPGYYQGKNETAISNQSDKPAKSRENDTCKFCDCKGHWKQDCPTLKFILENGMKPQDNQKDGSKDQEKKGNPKRK